MPKKDYAEADMYAPIRDFFVSMGYQVRGEVKGCDITMFKNDELLVVEMKKSFNMTLLFQLLERQKITSQVYAAIPNPRYFDKHGEVTKIKTICQKLGLGLILVNVGSAVKSIDVAAFPPVPTKPETSKAKTRRKAEVVREMEGRRLDLNQGGTKGRKLATAYREKAIATAAALRQAGEATAAELTKTRNAPKNAAQIMRSNYYSWFEKAADGKRYKLTETGASALENEWVELAAVYENLLTFGEGGGIM